MDSVHVDSDRYSSAAAVPRHVGPRLAAGSVLLVDEFLDHAGWEEHEYRARQEWLDRTARPWRTWPTPRRTSRWACGWSPRAPAPGPDRGSTTAGEGPGRTPRILDDGTSPAEASACSLTSVTRTPAGPGGAPSTGIDPGAT